ncbi:MAG: hypothetical protein MUE99_10120, partial [Chitinophagaceae bacterium]|nr:hypothetical protein [Chitinophagaceae bacterium]
FSSVSVCAIAVFKKSKKIIFRQAAGKPVFMIQIYEQSILSETIITKSRKGKSFDFTGERIGLRLKFSLTCYYRMIGY